MNKKPLLTLDGKNFIVKKIGNYYYALSNNKTIAMSETRKKTKELAMNYKIGNQHVKKNKIKVGLLSPMQLFSIIDNGDIKIEDVEDYFQKNYKEDIDWLHQQVNITLERFCRAKYYDNNLKLKKSIYWNKLLLNSSEYLGSDNTNILIRLFFNNLKDLEIKIFDKFEKQLSLI